ncbi:MAG: putative Holliday junction resolvase [Pseudohongiellaceae bacterium]|jgi:putative Holliday junction resolvase
MPEIISGKLPDQVYTALSFDFGSKKIGVASGQSLTGTASPLLIIKANDGIPNWDEIGMLVNQWQPALIIVGLPLNMDGTESKLSLRAKKFARRMAANYTCAVGLMDERLTSREARELSSHNGPIDNVAAALILESWFNSTN